MMWAVWCVPWGRLACPVSFLPWRMLMLLVHPGDKFMSQEVVLLSLWSVESLWLAEHFLLLTGPLVPTLLKCPPFDSGLWSIADALHVQEFWLSLGRTKLNSQGISCSSCQKVRQTKGLLNTLTPRSSAKLPVSHLLHFPLEAPSVSTVNFALCNWSLTSVSFSVPARDSQMPTSLKASRGLHTAGPCLHMVIEVCQGGASLHPARELH